MNCPSCGAAVAPGIPYCPSCHAAMGSAQPWGQGQQTYQQSRQQNPYGGYPDFAPASQAGQPNPTGYAQPAYRPQPSADLNTWQTQAAAYAPQVQGFGGQEERKGFQLGETLKNVLKPQQEKQTAQPGSGYPQQSNAYQPQYQQSGYGQQAAALQQNPYSAKPAVDFASNPAQPWQNSRNTFAPQTAQGQPLGEYAQQTGSYQPQSSGYTQPAGSYQPQSSGYAQPTASYQPQSSGYTQPTGSYQPQSSGYAQATGSYQPQSSGYAQPTGNYQPQNGGYGQQVNPYQQAYPSQAQGYGYQQQQHPNPVMALLSDLPRMFLGCFTTPGEVLRALVERGDVITGPIVLGVTLVVVFLGGMAAMRGVVSILFSLIASLTGISLANSTAALRQGVNYIAGQIAPAVGGIAVLCQIIAIIVPVAVVMGYLYLVHRMPLNWLMLLEMVTVTTMPTIAVALVAMLASMVSPVLALVMMILGVVLGYLQLSSMLATLLGGTEPQQLKVKMICFPIAILLTLVLIYLVGGNLMGNVFQHMVSLLGNMGTIV